jgi:hypothetical protein
MTRNDHEPRTSRRERQVRVAKRRRYEAPRLEVVRTLHQVVLGSSPGFGDSGAGSGPEFPPGGGP